MKALFLLFLLACQPTGPLHLETEVTAESVAPVAAQIEHATGRVILVIDSPGGEIDAGWQLVKAIERSPAQVTCVVDGMAASMAAVVLQSCDQRIMTERSLLMLHQASTRIQGQPDEIENDLSQLKLLTESLMRYCANRMHVPWKTLMKQIAHGREFWVGPDEALRWHMVDR